MQDVLKHTLHELPTHPRTWRRGRHFSDVRHVPRRPCITSPRSRSRSRSFSPPTMNVLGIDVGSSSVKAAVLNGGRSRGKLVRAPFTSRFEGVRAEVDPASVLRAVAGAIRQLGPAAKKVEAIALSVMSPSWLAMDKDGNAAHADRDAPGPPQRRDRRGDREEGRQATPPEARRQPPLPRRNQLHHLRLVQAPRAGADAPGRPRRPPQHVPAPPDHRGAGRRPFQRLVHGRLPHDRPGRLERRAVRGRRPAPRPAAGGEGRRPGRRPRHPRRRRPVRPDRGHAGARRPGGHRLGHAAGGREAGATGQRRRHHRRADPLHRPRPAARTPAHPRPGRRPAVDVGQHAGLGRFVAELGRRTSSSPTWMPKAFYKLVDELAPASRRGVGRRASSRTWPASGRAWSSGRAPSPA